MRKQPDARVEDRYEALFRVSQAIGAHREPKGLLSTLSVELRQMINFAFIGIAQYEEPTGKTTWLLSECDHSCDDAPESEGELNRRSPAGSTSSKNL
jgi:hypothetical protein